MVDENDRVSRQNAPVVITSRVEYGKNAREGDPPWGNRIIIHNAVRVYQLVSLFVAL